MSEPTVNTLFEEIKEDLKDYAQKKSDLMKLDAFEKAGKVSAVSFSGILILSLSFFVLLFLLVAGALYVGELTGDYSLGFVCMAGLLLLLTLLYVFLFKRMVEYSIMNSVIGLLMKNDDEKE